MPQQYQTVDVMSPMANIGQSVKSALSNVGQGISAGIGVVQNQKSIDQIRADAEKTRGEIEGRYKVVIGNLPAPRSGEKPEDYDARNKLYMAKKLTEAVSTGTITKDDLNGMLRTAGMNESDPMFAGAKEQVDRNQFMKDPMVQQRMPGNGQQPADLMGGDFANAQQMTSQPVTMPQNSEKPSAFDEMGQLTINAVKSGTMNPKDAYAKLADIKMEELKIERENLAFERDKQKFDFQTKANAAQTNRLEFPEGETALNMENSSKVSIGERDWGPTSGRGRGAGGSGSGIDNTPEGNLKALQEDKRTILNTIASMGKLETDQIPEGFLKKLNNSLEDVDNAIRQERASLGYETSTPVKPSAKASFTADKIRKAIEIQSKTPSKAGNDFNAETATAGQLVQFAQNIDPTLQMNLRVGDIMQLMDKYTLEEIVQTIIDGVRIKKESQSQQ